MSCGERPRLRLRAVLSFGLAVTAVVACVVQPSGARSAAVAARGRPTITGASRASCSTSPCQPGSGHDFTVSVTDNGSTTTRGYVVYRPANLVPSRRNRAPAIFLFGGGGACTPANEPQLAPLANAERLVIVELAEVCGRSPILWEEKYVACGVSPSCPAEPNDEPYVTAVVRAVTQCPASGAAANQCADPRRLYAIGASSGGDMVEDVMCSPENSRYFRGYGIDSATLPSTNNVVSTRLCPSSKPHSRSFNRDYFVMMATGDSGADTVFSQNQDRHLTVPTFASWAARVLGCRRERTDQSYVPDPSAPDPGGGNQTYSYLGPCAFASAGSRAVYTVNVHNGAHYFNCQDSDRPGAYFSGNPGAAVGGAAPCPGVSGLPMTGGWDFFGEFWSMMAAGRSR
jgi:poly(3-hydroxybutyrate) depolymerase